MNSFHCDWEEITAPDDRGWRKLRCRKCGLLATSDKPVERIFTAGGCGGRGLKPSPPEGPGSYMHDILKDAGASADLCAGLCEQWRLLMDEWGVEGCLERRAEIVNRITEAMFRTWVTDQIRIGWSIAREPWFAPLDPVGCIVDEAIRRAEAKASASSDS